METHANLGHDAYNSGNGEQGAEDAQNKGEHGMVFLPGLCSAAAPASNITSPISSAPTDLSARVNCLEA